MKNTNYKRCDDLKLQIQLNRLMRADASELFLHDHRQDRKVDREMTKVDNVNSNQRPRVRP